MFKLSKCSSHGKLNMSSLEVTLRSADPYVNSQHLLSVTACMTSTMLQRLDF